MSAPRIILLGPQRLRPTLDRAVADAGIEGRIAAVTAGWEEREGEDEELRDHLGGRVVNLDVFQRAEDVFAHDSELFAGMQLRYDTLRRQQELYRQRLAHTLEAARELLRQEGEDELLEVERSSAIEAVRALDAHHLAQVLRIHAAFDEEYRPRERRHVVRHREELRRELAGCEALCVAGGHVAILLNRMRLFDLPQLHGERPIFAWSAGAMALAERIVLFHDSPPQGAGDAEVLEAGLGVHRGLVPLPHAKRRLRLGDATRVALFARRFGPDICCVLDEETRIEWDGQRWKAAEGTTRLTAEGGVEQAA